MSYGSTRTATPVQATALIQEPLAQLTMLQQAMSEEADLLDLESVEAPHTEEETTEFGYEEIGEIGELSSASPENKLVAAAHTALRMRVGGCALATLLLVVAGAALMQVATTPRRTADDVQLNVEVQEHIQLQPLAANATERTPLEKTDAPELANDHPWGSDANGTVAMVGEMVNYMKCPPGNYLSHSELDQSDRNSRLQAFHVQMQKSGLVANPRDSVHFLERGFATFESLAWPKLGRCSVLPDEDWAAEHDKTGDGYKQDQAPAFLKRLESQDFNLQFNLNPKTASTALLGYLECAYGEFEASHNSNFAAREDDRVVAAVREPLSRFASGVHDLLRRVVDGDCATGKCALVDSRWSDASRDQLAHQTSWFQYVRTGYDNATLHDVVQAFVHDVACNYYSYASDLFTSQSVFVTQNSGVARDVDTVVKLESLEEDLSDLAKSFGLDGNGHCVPADEFSTGGASSSLPTEDDVLAVIEADSALTMDLCRVYAQDFICFDYELPAVCESIFPSSA